jgi:hypothetical protein
MLAALGNARRLLHQRAPARRRMLRNQEVIHGVAPDGRGRWVVEGILEWRDGAMEREALVVSILTQAGRGTTRGNRDRG